MNETQYLIRQSQILIDMKVDKKSTGKATNYAIQTGKL